MENIQIEEFIKRRKANPRLLLIDVRSPGEYRAAHIEGAVNHPIDSLNADAVSAMQSDKGSPIYVVCQTGGRSRRAGETLSNANLNVVNVDGGTTAAINTGAVEIKRSQNGTMSIERQVRIGAGSLVLIGAILGFTVHPYFFFLSAFIGAGLVFAGVTDTCTMGMLLAKAPWNR